MTWLHWYCIGTRYHTIPGIGTVSIPGTNTEREQAIDIDTSTNQAKVPGKAIRK